jgi:hypothetical protein
MQFSYASHWLSRVLGRRRFAGEEHLQRRGSGNTNKGETALVQNNNKGKRNKSAKKSLQNTNKFKRLCAGKVPRIGLLFVDVYRILC